MVSSGSKALYSAAFNWSGGKSSLYSTQVDPKTVGLGTISQRGIRNSRPSDPYIPRAPSISRAASFDTILASSDRRNERLLRRRQALALRSGHMKIGTTR
jgi:hypothetical protein